MLVLARSLAKVREEEAGGDEGDDGGGLVGLRADDAGTRGPKESGDREDTVKPVGRRDCNSADNTGTGRQQGDPESGEQETGEEMEA